MHGRLHWYIFRKNFGILNSVDTGEGTNAAAWPHQDAFIGSHAWNYAHWIGACTLAAVRQFGPTMAIGAWNGFCACHTQSVRTTGPSSQNMGPYMRAMLTCALSNTNRDTALIGTTVVYCLSLKVNQHIQTGG